MSPKNEKARKKAAGLRNRGHHAGRESSAPRRKNTAGSGPDSNPEWFRTLDDIAAWFKISKRSYCRRRGQPGFPKKQRLGYSVEDVRAYLERCGLYTDNLDELNKDAEQAKKAHMDWRWRQMQLQKAKRDLISRQTHEDEMQELAGIFLQGLADFREHVFARIRAPEIASAVELCIERTRTAIAERLEREIAEEVKNGEADQNESSADAKAADGQGNLALG